MKGLREVMAGVAYHAGTPFTQLAPKRLFAFENEDMAKSWAFYMYIATETGREGQLWLRGLSAIVMEPDFQVLLRKHTEECFADIQGDAVNILEEKWKAYLERNFGI
jgi:hypothetical protein